MNDNTISNNIVNSMNVMNIIETINNNFDNLYCKYTIENLKKSNVVNVETEYDFIKQHCIPNVYEYYLNGHCVSYADILRNIFEQYATQYNSSYHVITKIGEHFYDVRGIIDDLVTNEFHITEPQDIAYIDIHLGIKDEIEMSVEKELINIGINKLNQNITEATKSKSI